MYAYIHVTSIPAPANTRTDGVASLSDPSLAGLPTAGRADGSAPAVVQPVQPIQPEEPEDRLQGHSSSEVKAIVTHLTEVIQARLDAGADDVQVEPLYGVIKLLQSHSDG